MLKVLIILLTGLAAESSMAFDYFTEPIDYWDKKVEDGGNEKKSSSKHPTPKFDWSKHLDPEQDNFFKEGNHIPSGPFMELARNPSDENIRLWFELIKRKNTLMARLQKRVSEYAAKNNSTGQSTAVQTLAKSTSSHFANAPDPKRFRFRLYFESSCPHCKDMMKTMQDLSQLGYYVEVKQIDQKQPGYPVPFPIRAASARELKERNIESWPVLFVADTSKKQVIRINGFHPTASVISALSKQ